MAIGNVIRRNVAKISPAERKKLRDAILQLNGAKFYPDGVSYWDKQDKIHEATHVHNGASFLPWHRELCNRFEELLREVDSSLALHYWDWTTDPRASVNGAGGTTNLFSTGVNGFMGSANGPAGSPLAAFNITRQVQPGAPGVSPDASIVGTGSVLAEADQYFAFRGALEGAHNIVHPYVGGTIGDGHTAFEDPFVFLLHSNVDRLFARWQVAPGKSFRRVPAQVYGSEGSSTGVRGIMTMMEPWAGGPGLRPWAPPENQQVAKNSKHPTVVNPPLYDTNINEQNDWRWCSKCQGLFFGGNPGSKCPAGGAHIKVGSGNYHLVQNTVGVPGQTNWRWCSKCQGLFFGGNPGSKCPAGGAHIKLGSGNYRLVQNLPGVPGQANWRWCSKCQGLHFAGNPGSKCPAGGPHITAGSGDYRLVNR